MAHVVATAARRVWTDTASQARVIGSSVLVAVKAPIRAIEPQGFRLLTSARAASVSDRVAV